MTPTRGMPAELVIAPRLRPGEKLLWTGVPKRGVQLTSSDRIVIPFSLLWCGFAIFWEYTVLSTGAPLLFRLWGIPFIGVGVYMVVGRFFYDAFRRSRIWYGITGRRVIIISEANEVWVNPAAIGQIQLEQQSTQNRKYLTCKVERS